MEDSACWLSTEQWSEDGIAEGKSRLMREQNLSISEFKVLWKLRLLSENSVC